VRATPELLQHGRLLPAGGRATASETKALAVCSLRQVDHIDTFGASSLSTLVQMVANGLGMTLLPELSLDVESRHGGIRLMRFVEPEPSARRRPRLARAARRASPTSPRSAA